MEIEEEQKMKR